MNHPAFALPIPILGFAALWCGIVKVIALLGWQRLAASYRVDELPAVPRKWLSLAYVGFIQYQNVIRANASSEGLGLSVIFPFRIGHPPLLIPWQAIGPVHKKKKWLQSRYSITIHTDDTSSLDFEFTNDSFLVELRPWLSLIDVR
jgi:hypothetical protein